MTSDPRALHITTLDQPSNPNASFTSHASSNPEPRQHHPRRREMEGHDRDNDRVQDPSALGQFSLAPTTRTTVVTTTTTTTTSFPPLIIKPPKAIKELDSRQYPLAASPTPASLRNLKFKIGDKSIVFNEPDDSVAASTEVGRPSCFIGRASLGPDILMKETASGKERRPPVVKWSPLFCQLLCI